ncbi:MAG: TIM barrel protein [bacterium]|nr:TIM barrel protein [bacterium]
MEFGVVSHAVGHHMSFEKTLAAIKDLGFGSVLLLTNRDADPVGADGTCKNAFPNVLGSDPVHVRKALYHAGVEVGALHFSGKIDIESDAGIESGIEALKEYAVCALSLGCKYLTLPVPSCGRSGVPTEEKAAEIRRFAACMNGVAEAFGEQGLQVGCDIHYKAWVEGLEDCRLLLDSMPCENAGILLNIGHMTTVQSYGWLLVDEYPDRIPVVGWKDHSLAKDRSSPMLSIELGTGQSPFELYVKAFKRNPAERVHLVNCEHVPDDQRADALRRSNAYMTRFWDEVG